MDQRLPPAATLARWVAPVLVVVGLLLAGAAFELGPFRADELSRGELIVRADQICAEANRAFSEQQAKPPQTPQQAAELTGHLVGIAEDESKQIAELERPPDVEAELEAYLEARDRGIELLKQGRAAAEDGDAEAYVQAQDELDRTQPARWELARQIGFSECSRPFGEATSGG